ncbi:MAG: hypothetical protein PHF75_06025, partial [Gallionella sp.]|nr:hypothetical protein [Gallionella sp.]
NGGMAQQGGYFPPGWLVYALWPAPVNDDECFHKAGYNDFQSQDEHYCEAHWEQQANILHQRLIEVMEAMGQAELLNKPLFKQRTIAGFWTGRKPLPLTEQLWWPLIEDNVPEASVRFGQFVQLRTGNGHHLYWLALSPDAPLNFTGVLQSVAQGWPRRCVQLDWGKL